MMSLSVASPTPSCCCTCSCHLGSSSTARSFLVVNWITCFSSVQTVNRKNNGVGVKGGSEGGELTSSEDLFLRDAQHPQ
jgi:hypothetical protein